MRFCQSAGQVRVASNDRVRNCSMLLLHRFGTLCPLDRDPEQFSNFSLQAHFCMGEPYRLCGHGNLDMEASIRTAPFQSSRSFT
ncbi:hypothetical protein ppKF707_0532 [Metapseudomonas furukawaii]|nr:hypothetical protein ppKF707_0532 [Pseudomonas furukawaii]